MLFQDIFCISQINLYGAFNDADSNDEGGASYIQPNPQTKSGQVRVINNFHNSCDLCRR